MFNISQYLEKFRNLTSHETQVKQEVVRATERVVGVEIERDAISYHNKQVFITAHPLIKNEIMVHKKEVLREVKPHLDCVVNDIR